MRSEVTAFCLLFLCVIPGLGFLSCSVGPSRCETLKNPELIFDGGSVVFEIQTSRMGQVFLMISPRREIDPGTGALLGHDGFILYCVDRDERGGYEGRAELLVDSEMETAILEKLGKCRDHFASRRDPWTLKVEKLVRMIETREGRPPDATEWK